MHLYIVRHGQSTGNISTDDVPDGELTPLGQQQARETAARLADCGITHVLSSPLIRALATGTAIAEAAGIEHVEVWPELQEHRQNLHRGFGREELLRNFPKAVFPHSVEADGWDHGGETYESALERGAAAMQALRARHAPDDCVAVATHGAFANYLLRSLLHVPAQHSVWFRMNNCGISRVNFTEPSDGELSYESAEAEIIIVNDVSHLSEIS
ncbi:MAG: histidine phosphatase family protein [Chloroflexi bacterium]|jgi:broad specificity phosphatase PhoE|nr:histidine phosphatase family protein [Chloroflexota bacterium]